MGRQVVEKVEGCRGDIAKQKRAMEEMKRAWNGGANASAPLLKTPEKKMARLNQERAKMGADIW